MSWDCLSEEIHCEFESLEMFDFSTIKTGFIPFRVPTGTGIRTKQTQSDKQAYARKRYATIPEVRAARIAATNKYQNKNRAKVSERRRARVNFRYANDPEYRAKIIAAVKRWKAKKRGAA